MNTRSPGYAHYQSNWRLQRPYSIAFSSLRKLEIDSNTYTLGSMSGHNIVIACLPSAVYGTSSATSLVAYMKRTFPPLRFGLIVGVGGGVPFSGADVRPGDVVVGTPIGKQGGVGTKYSPPTAT
ncbi:hypothetical protein BO85DRAFT_25496 [Aspergillus piperis CBS 112811]|uniref:Purine and uridine phosphorylase n=1 Tax=Aspergillus piperis CBS 112811 TaxID=1448313 RepID=A0A8G1RF21_9EURO|nr:hypothetical protein BO85DRAFT_25496 [Aspergillus piperis CBS 112811]RAH63509.1 hypothetical protein BO85DRAFT_25496 [Aspergillus piperis CBS 112811]